MGIGAAGGLWAVRRLELKLWRGIAGGVSHSTALLSVCLSVLQHGPRVSLGCRSNEFLDHAKT
jgi:hypothetical protein